MNRLTFFWGRKSLYLMEALQETAYKQLDYTATNSQTKKKNWKLSFKVMVKLMGVGEPTDKHIDPSSNYVTNNLLQDFQYRSARIKSRRNTKGPS